MTTLRNGWTLILFLWICFITINHAIRSLDWDESWLEKQETYQAALAVSAERCLHVVLEDDSIGKHDQSCWLKQVGDLIRTAGEMCQQIDIERGESRLNDALLTGESKR